MGNYTHMQNKDGKTIKVTGVKKDGQMYFEGDDGIAYSVPKKMFLDSYNEGKIKIGNIDDKGNFVEYKLPNIGTAEKAAKLFFAPYGTMAKGDWDLKTAGQDVLNFSGIGSLVNYGIDKLIPNENTNMKTSLEDALLGAGLSFLGYKALPSAAHRKVPFLNISDTDKLMKKEIPEILTKGEAYGATHPSIPITTQQEQEALNRQVANSVYRKYPVFKRKVQTPLDDEFVRGTRQKKTGEVHDKSNVLRSANNSSDKTKVGNEMREGSQQGGGTEHIRQVERGQQPSSDWDLGDISVEKPKEVPSDVLGVNRTIDKERNFDKSAQNSGTVKKEITENASSSVDVNTDGANTREIYKTEDFVENAPHHTATNTRPVLLELYKNNSKEANQIKNAKTLNELNDVVANIRKRVNTEDIDRWEQAMKEWITAVVDPKGEVEQANKLRGAKIKYLDKINIEGESPKLKSNITFTKIPRRGGTVADYIKSYGESQYPGAKYPIGVTTFLSKQAIPVLRNKDDESFNEGTPSGDEVFDEIRKSMNKNKSSLQYVDPNPRKK